MASSLGDLLVRVGANIDGFEKSMGDISKRLNAVDREASKAFSGFDRIADRIGTVATAAGTALTAAVTLPLAGAGLAATNFAGNFEAALNKIKALGDNITGPALERLRNQALQLGKDTKFSAQQAADGMALFASAGLSAEEIFRVMPGTLSLAAAGMFSIEEAAFITKNTIGQFQLEVGEAGRVADVFAQVSADTSVSMQGLGVTFGYVGAVAHGAGQTLEETGAAIVALDKAGIQAEKAGTGLRGVLGSLIAPSKEAKREMDALGVSISDQQGNIRPLSDIMEQFRSKLAKVGSEAERQRIIFEVFGREAGNSAQVLIQTGGPALDAFEQKLVSSGGAADRMAKTMNQGLNYSLEQFKGSVETAGIALGTALLPVVGRMIDFGTQLVNEFALPAATWFGELPEPVQNAALAFGLMAAAAGPILIVVGQMATGIVALLPAITSLSGVVATFAAGPITTLATVTIPALTLSLRTFALTTVPAAITAISAMASVMLSQGVASMTTFATVSIPAAITALTTFATGAVASAIAGVSTLATTTLPAAIASFTTLATGGIAAAASALYGFATTAVAAAISAVQTLALTVLPILTVAAIAAAAAFGGFKLGEWLYETVPAFKAFGDAAGDFLLKIPGLESAVLRLSGAAKALSVASEDLDFATQKLEKALLDKGITVDRAGKSTGEYAKALREAAKQSGFLGDASSTEKAKVEAIKKQIQESEEKAKLTARAMKELGREVRDAGDKHKQAIKPISDLAIKNGQLAMALKILQDEHDKAKRSVDAYKASILLGRAETVNFEQVLGDLNSIVKDAGLGIQRIADIHAPAFITTVSSAAGPVVELEKALGTLGVKGAADLKKIADESAKARDAVLGSGIASDFEKKTAIYKALQAQIEHAKVAGIEIAADQKKLLQDLESEIGDKVPKMAGTWQDFGNSISTVITNAAQDITKSLFSGELSFAEKGKEALKALGSAVSSSFIEPATAAISNFISGVLTDLIGGKGLSGVIAKFSELGSSISGIFGGASAPSVPSGTPSGGSIPSGGGGGGVPGGASGLGGTVDLITGAISAASNVISAIYNVRIEGTLNQMERNTAAASIHLENILKKANEFWPWMRETHMLVGETVVGVLREIRDGLKTLFSVNVNVGGEQEKALIASLITRVGTFDTLATDRLLDIYARAGEINRTIQDGAAQVVTAIGAGFQSLAGSLAAIENKLPSTLEKALGGGGGVLGGIAGLAGTLPAAISGLIAGLIRGSGKTEDLIEENTRFAAVGIIGPAGVVDTLREFLPYQKTASDFNYDVAAPWMADVQSALEGRLSDNIVKVHDALIDIRGSVGSQISEMTRVADTYSGRIVSSVLEVRDAIRTQTAEQARVGAAPPVQVNIQGNVIGQREFVQQMTDAVMAAVRLQLVKT